MKYHNIREGIVYWKESKKIIQNRKKWKKIAKKLQTQRNTSYI